MLEGRKRINLAYIGNGQIVDAANPGTGVRVAGVFSMPFSGARRIG